MLEDDEKHGAEEGEEESPRVSDCNVSDEEGMDADDARTVMTQTMRLNPSLMAGTMQPPGMNLTVQKNQPKRKKMEAAAGKIAETLEQGLDEQGDEAEIEVHQESDLPEWILGDNVLKEVALKTGKIYKCFSSLRPEVNLMAQKPVGHKLTGVGTGLKIFCKLCLGLGSRPEDKGRDSG